MLKKQVIYLAVLLAIFFTFSNFIAPVLAQDPGGTPLSEEFESDKFKPLSQAEEFPLKDSVNTKDPGLNRVIATASQAIVGIVGAAAFFMMVVSGLQLLFTQGNEEKVDKAKKTLLWSFLGVLVVFAAYAIISLVIETSLVGMESGTSSAR